MVSAKTTSFFPVLGTEVSRRTRALETAVSSWSTTRVTWKTALNAGSSQQGKARRASVDSNCVEANVFSRPLGVFVGAAIKTVKFIVQDTGSR